MLAPQVRANSGAQAEKKAREIAIRPANALDATPLYQLLMAYFNDMRAFYPGPDLNATMAWGLAIVVQGGCILATSGGKIVGSVAVEIGTFPWNPQFKYLNGVWFYVAPEFRKGGTANKLMAAAKDIAAKMNMALRLDNVWGIDPEMQDAYRKNHGFQYVGGNHVWFPPPPAEA